MKKSYYPEGTLINTAENTEYISSIGGLERAFVDGRILESIVTLCDSSLRLHVSLGDTYGIMEKEECVFCRSGEAIKDIAIITRVGKPVAFKITGFQKINGKIVAILSRKAAQQECQKNFISLLSPGDIIPAKVTHLENFGAFVDIGCGLSSLLTVDSISVSRISHPKDRLSVGQSIFVVVKPADISSDRIYVSMKELLGTWEENASMFEVGQTVPGIVRSIEDYGIFVELSPNLAGLAELRADSRDTDIPLPGNTVAVYIKSILPDRMKIKLVLIDDYRGALPDTKPHYFIDVSQKKHISSWRYSPPSAPKIIQSIFDK